MNFVSAKWLRATGCATILGTILTFGSGCGALGAMANPKVAWAVNDPANMNVVVRRADAAATTAKEVDRILTATPANPDSEWVAKVGPAKTDSDTQLKSLGEHPAYKTTKARVVASEVWVKTLPGVQSKDGQYPNLLSAVDKGLGEQYAKVMAKKKELADLKAQITIEEDAADQKGVSDADKKAHKDKAKELDAQADKVEDEVDPLQDQFIKSAKEAAAKAPADVKSKFGSAFVNLRQAVEDANISNGAAAVKYPMAAPGIKDAAQDQVGIIVADVIEEQTGRRPMLSGFHPDLRLEGTKVDVTLNGLSKDDMGKIAIGDLTTEVLKREQKWVGHAAGLLGSISSTKEILSFEEKVLDAILDGFKSGGWTPPAAAAIEPTASK